MKKPTVLIISMIVCLVFSSQILADTIWSEDFSSYTEGTGADGTGYLGDYPSSVSKWSLDATGANLEDNGDYCKTVSGVLKIQDSGGDMIWLSESIDVSGYANVSFSLDAAEFGEHEDVDYFNVEYKIDSGSFTLITNWNSKGDDTHTLFDDWDSETISVSSLSGSSLQIKVTVKNNAATEQMQLDNVTVTGTNVTPPTNLMVTNITSDKARITWTKPSGTHSSDWDGVVVLMNANQSETPDLFDVSAQSYSTVYGTGTSNNTYYYIQNHTADSDGDVTITGLSDGTTYKVVIVSYNDLDGGTDEFNTESVPSTTATAAVPEVSGGSQTLDYTQLDLGWTAPSGTQETWWDQVVIIAREGSAVEDSVCKSHFETKLIDATLLITDATWTAIDDAADVYGKTTDVTNDANYFIYSGTGTSVSLTGLTAATHYYLKIMTYYVNASSAHIWSTGIATDMTTLQYEPTNHVTSFTATADGASEIDLSWIADDGSGGSIVAESFLIKASTGSVSAPVDGADPSEDADLSDGSAIVKIAHGATTHSFTGLSDGTTYNFKIYPYVNSGSNIDFKTDQTVPDANATTDELPNFVINEIHADPDASSGDANGDGSIDPEDDEFVEIVNRSGSTVDISGWKIYDGIGLKHTVPISTSLGNNVALVIFGGGTPTGIPGIVQTASTGTLGLNNSGDDVILKNSSDITIISHTYGSEAGYDQSIARNPDFTGDFVKHSTISGNAVLFSPGKMNATDQSLPVELQDFKANPGNGKVTLTWITESETENLGFNLYRSVNKNGEFLMLNAELIAGHGSTSEMHEYSYIDRDVVNGVTCYYKLEDVDYAGKAKLHDKVVSAAPTSKESDANINEFRLYPCYPNPFNPETTLRFELTEAAMINVHIYDLLGNRITTLSDAAFQPGEHNLTWNGRDHQNRLVGTGIYFLQISDDRGFSRTEKVIFLR